MSDRSARKQTLAVIDPSGRKVVPIGEHQLDLLPVPEPSREGAASGDPVPVGHYRLDVVTSTLNDAFARVKAAERGLAIDRGVALSLEDDVIAE